jgi:glycerophosphoryl diester phosphodiesterase
MSSRNLAVTRCGWLVMFVLACCVAQGQTYQPCADTVSIPQQAPQPYNTQTVINALQHPIQDTNGNFVLLSAHRGLWQNAPENSMEAFYAASNAGIEILEIDVRGSMDGDQPMLIHDNELSRLTTGSGLLTKTTAAAFLQLHTRDRRGCPTTVNTLDLATAFQKIADSRLVYLDPNNSSITRGETLVLDIKGSINNLSDWYNTLVNSVNVWRAQVALHPALANSVVFKVRLRAMPPNPSTFTGLWTTPPYPKMMYVLYNDDPNTIKTPTAAQTQQAIANGQDALFTAYYNAPSTIEFETNELYNGDTMAGYRLFLTTGANGLYPWTIAGYSPDNYFPEGEPSGGSCCHLLNTTMSGSNVLPPQPGCLSPKPNCLDLRGWWDVLYSEGMSMFTLERANDAETLFGNLGVRNTKLIQQP